MPQPARLPLLPLITIVPPTIEGATLLPVFISTMISPAIMLSPVYQPVFPSTTMVGPSRNPPV
jgi:hypothetical protein